MKKVGPEICVELAVLKNRQELNTTMVEQVELNTTTVDQEKLETPIANHHGGAGSTEDQLCRVGKLEVQTQV